MTFTDRTEAAGIDFTHVRGSSGEKYMAEIVGAGAALFDYDDDGFLDLYLVNGAALPGFQTQTTPRNVLYRNNGDGTFTDVTAHARVGDPGYGMGTAVADYDNDGFLDLYVTNFGPDVLYRNNGDGTFADVTTEAGLGCELWGTSSAFGDIDNDGDLDLYVDNYVDFSLENHIVCGGPETGGRDYCHPRVYHGLPDVLYRNEGNGSFSDVTRSAGVYTNEGKGLGVVMVDYDNDSDTDIYVANDSVPNFLWRNRGDGSFEEVGLLSGVAFSEDGLAEAGMGVDFGDYDGDGLLDLFVTNYYDETNTLYRNTGRAWFVDETTRSGMGEPSLMYVGFGTGFVDYDNDGDLDAFVANGHVLETVDFVDDGVFFEQPNLLFNNDGRGRFEDVSEISDAHFELRRSSRGTAFGDYDNDGDVDLLVTNSRASPNLLRNDGVHQNHMLAIRAVGREANRDGIGTRVRIHAAGRQQLRDVHGAYSYCSHNDLRVHFGLGNTLGVERVELVWPSGTIENLGPLDADHLYVVTLRVVSNCETCTAPTVTAATTICAFTSAWETEGGGIVQALPMDVDSGASTSHVP